MPSSWLRAMALKKSSSFWNGGLKEEKREKRERERGREREGESQREREVKIIETRSTTRGNNHVIEI